MEFGPKEITIKDVGITSIGAFVGAVIGSIIMLILIFSLSSFINISDGFTAARNGIGEKNSIFPLVLSIITFISTSATIFITYNFLHFANPERYKKNNIIFGQIAFFTFFVYFLLAFLYVYLGLIDYDYIMIMFIIHTILVIFGSSLVVEVMNNYRYILVSIYGSFLGLIVAIILSSLIFGSISSGQAKLMSLLFLLPIINITQILFKGLFELAYYKYNLLTGQDQIGDIFYQIENEEKQALKEEEEKNTI